MTSSSTNDLVRKISSEESLSDVLDENFDAAFKEAAESESRAQQSYALLQAKDEELEKLRRRVTVLEDMASTLSDTKFVPTLRLPPPREGRLSPTVGASATGEALRRQLASGDAQPTNPEDESCYGQEMEQMNDSTEDSMAVLVNLQNYNYQLRNALSCENRLRVKDRSRFIKVLDEVHSALKSLKSGPVITPCRMFVELAAEWFKGEMAKQVGDKDAPVSGEVTDTRECVETVEVGRAGERTSEEVQELLSPKNILFAPVDAEGNPCSLRVEKQTNQNEMAERCVTHEEISVQADLKGDGDFVSRLDQINSDLHDLHVLVCTSQEKVLEEQLVQRRMQSAWSARFKVQTSTFQRLEKRYRRVSKCLLNFRKKIKIRNMVNQNLQKDKAVEGAVEEPAVKNNRVETILEKDQTDCKLRGVGLLVGRLRAAGVLIAQQKKEIERLAKEKELQQKETFTLKQRFLRTESSVAMSNVLRDHQQKKFCTIEQKNNEILDRYSVLTRDMLSLKCALNSSQTKVNVLKDKNDGLVKQMEGLEAEFVEKNSLLQREMKALSTHLDQEKKKTRLCEQRMSLFHEEFLKHVHVARDRITVANKMLREVFKTIQMLLRLVFMSQMPAALTEAENLASSILNISAKDMQSLMNPEDEYPQLQSWVNQCRNMMKKEMFAKELSEFLYSVSLGNRTAFAKPINPAVEV